MANKFEEVPGALREEERWALPEDVKGVEERTEEALEAQLEIPAAQAEAESEVLKARAEEQRKTLEERAERRASNADAKAPEVKAEERRPAVAKAEATKAESKS